MKLFIVYFGNQYSYRIRREFFDIRKIKTNLTALLCEFICFIKVLYYFFCIINK